MADMRSVGDVLREAGETERLAVARDAAEEGVHVAVLGALARWGDGRHTLPGDPGEEDTLRSVVPSARQLVVAGLTQHCGRRLRTQAVHELGAHGALHTAADGLHGCLAAGTWGAGTIEARQGISYLSDIASQAHRFTKKQTLALEAHLLS